MEKKFISDDAFSGSPTDKENNNVHMKVCHEMLSELSTQQKAAVDSTAKTILLIAPAGTGKTRTLTGRVIDRFAKGDAPERTLVCTFTNAAAAELKDRIEPAVRISLDDLWIGTTHSIGLRILRANAGDFGLTGADSIVDPEQQIQIIRRILTDLDHRALNSPDEKGMISRVMKFIEDAKTRLMPPEDAERAYNERDLSWAAGIGAEEIEIYKRYENFKKMYDMIDYNDMIYMPTQLLESNPKIREAWRNKFDSILVDEYQDLSSLQIRLLANLIDIGRTSFFAAADDDQCIYTWRGSDLKSTIRFSDYWPDTVIMKLTDNYRTPKPIFDTASSLIRNVADRHEKNIRTAPDPDALVRYIEAPDPASEKASILQLLLDSLKAYDTTHERIAILCRTNKSCHEMAAYLASNNVPVNLHEGLPLNTQPVSTLIAWMQLATKADNPMMFQRMIGYPNELIDMSKAREVEQRVQRRNEKTPDARTGPVAYVLEMHAKGKIPKGSGADEFVVRVNEVRAMITSQPDENGEKKIVSSPFARVGEHLGIKAAQAVSDRSEDHAYVRFVHMADEMVGQIGLEKTLASLNSLDLNAGRPGVNVTTMHGAKGLEFDVVFAPEWEDGEFPSWRREKDGEIDNERRLAYVTITRARRMLVVSYSMSRKNGQGRASRFIEEMGRGRLDAES